MNRFISVLMKRGPSIVMALVVSTVLLGAGFFATKYAIHFVADLSISLNLWPAFIFSLGVIVLLILMWFIFFRLVRPFWRAAFYVT